MVVFMSFSNAFNAIITSITVCLISTRSQLYMPDLLNKKHYDDSASFEEATLPFPSSLEACRILENLVLLTYIFLQKLSKHDE